VAELDGVLYKEIVEHGLREFPNECCGFIAAQDGVPCKVFTMSNIDASTNTFRIDGKEQLQVSSEMDERGLELWGIYHSHTHSEAVPSPTDVQQATFRQAFYPDSRNIIVSLADRAAPVMRSFFIVDGGVTEEELTIQ
jgi:[CysO sulfur-carrier protein]-S-L-cysteine hydrolase